MQPIRRKLEKWDGKRFCRCCRKLLRLDEPIAYESRGFHEAYYHAACRPQEQKGE